MNCYSKDCQFINDGYGDILKRICSVCPNIVYEQYILSTLDKTLSEKELKEKYEMVIKNE